MKQKWCWINAQAVNLFGWHREELLGQKIEILVPERFRSTHSENRNGFLARPHARAMGAGQDLFGLRRDGTEFPVEISLSPLETNEGTLVISAIRDITNRRQAERELEASRAQLRGYLARREVASEEERKYIAREVHDELGQVLTGLQLNVSVITHKFAADAPALREYLQETMMLTNRALDAVRNVTSALRPAALEMGIVSALEWLAGRFGANQGIQCVVHVADAEIQFGENHAIALYRIVQESLTNVARHAAASNVEITLVREGDDYVLKVHDNGTGFDASVKKEKFLRTGWYSGTRTDAGWYDFHQ